MSHHQAHNGFATDNSQLELHCRSVTNTSNQHSPSPPGPSMKRVSDSHSSRSSGIPQSSKVSPNATFSNGLQNPNTGRNIPSIVRSTSASLRINSDRSDPASLAVHHVTLRGYKENETLTPQTNLSILDVAGLILNKQIGTGIFTTPGAVLLSTKSKGLSVALWVIGGAWTCFLLLVYLEFGNALPFNGAELVYLDEVIWRPELLVTVLFSGFFLCFANSYGNSTQFAKHVLIYMDPHLENTKELDPRLVRYIAISVITVVCAIHWFSSRTGLFLNKLVAWYKIALLLLVFIAGMIESGKNGSKWNDPVDRGPVTDGMAGMVLIFYSYQGYENSNYVAGEIRALEGRAHRRTLNAGALLGVFATWVLYVLVAVSIYHVLDYDTLTGPNGDVAIALSFGPRVLNSEGALKILMALSAFGNVLAVTYTASRVKQSIAIQRILPFWRYLQRDDRTPKGALVLHWITSVIFISAAPTSSDGYSFAIGLYTYGHIIFSGLVAVCLMGLKSRMRSQPGKANWKLLFFENRVFCCISALLLGLGNLLVLIVSGKASLPGRIPRYWWPVTIILILFVSLLYWTAMRLTMTRTNRVDATGNPQTLGQLIGINVKVYNVHSGHVPDDVQKDIDDAIAEKIDGSRRRVVVETSGWVQRVGQGFHLVHELLMKHLT